MKDFIRSIQTALNNKNWYSALILSLLVPDICSNFDSNDGERIKDRYIKWYDKYMSKKYPHLSGEQCYYLRCSISHEGTDKIKDSSRDSNFLVNQVLDYVKFSGSGSHNGIMKNNFTGNNKYDNKNILILSVNCFSLDLIEAAKKWLSENPSYEIDLKINETSVEIGGFHFG